jgi:DNA-binding GntR family transcriptional regulator
MTSNRDEVKAPLSRGSLPRAEEDLIPTRAAAVLARLRTMIRDGTFAPGEHLLQKELGERFGVSTTPIREAFTSLAREGYIRYSPHQGAVVFDPSIEELEEISNIRIVLEGLATEIACPNLQDEEIAELRSIVERMGRADTVEEGRRLNREFHTVIYNAAAQPRLLEMITPLREASAAYQNRLVHRFEKTYWDEAQREHEGILKALTAGASVEAAKRLRLHLEHYKHYVARMVQPQ